MSVYVEVTHSPNQYTRKQLDMAMRVAYAFGRGRFLLLEPPENT